MRRYPRIKRAGCPASVLSCTAWGFSCLANCFASGELLPRLFTLTCTLLPKNRRYLFCDTLRHRSLSTATPACFTRHAAVWCSDFPPASQKGSPAIICHRSIIYHSPARKKREQLIGQIRADTEEVRDVSTPLDITRSKRGWHRHEENRDHQERDKKFANHRTEISQQTPPAGPAGIYHSFAGDEFTGDRANHRSNK
jgi:hypothetical protein